MGIVIPINLPDAATYDQFAACIPEEVTMRLKKRSFLFDAGMVPICNAIIIPVTMLEGIDDLIAYKKCRIFRFSGVAKHKSDAINAVCFCKLSESALRAKGGDYYMFWRSTGYGYKVRQPRSKFPDPVNYDDEDERDRKNPYISLLLPKVGSGSVELYITSRRSAERKIERKEVKGIIISRIKGMRILNEYNGTVDDDVRTKLRERTVRLAVQ